MKVIEVSQGSQAWLDLRAKHNTASEAPAVMGASKYMSRSDLMKQKTTGITPDVGSAKQALFNRGHAAEAGSRAILERIIGEDLYPVTAVCEKTNLLASLDGLNMSETIVFENKLWNEQLAEQVRAGDLEPHYYWQLEQELLVTGAEKVIFVTSDGTEDKFVSMEYRPVPGRAEQLIAAWKQFDADLATYKPEVASVEAIGRTPETLPALHIEVTGMVTASNLQQYKDHALAVFGSINRDLKTDQDFADARKAVKWCGDIETRIKAAKAHALSQTESIDQLFRTMDDIGAECKRVRLEIDGLVKTRDGTLRQEIVAGGRDAFNAHIDALNTRLGKNLMPTVVVNFAGVIKGMSKFDNMRDAVATELARLKIEANGIADKIQANIAAIAQADHDFLFSDSAILVQKEPEFVGMVIKNRIADHAAKEAARIEATRARIRQEEIDRLAREQAERDRIEAKRVADEAAQTALQSAGAALLAARVPVPAPEAPAITKITDFAPAAATVRVIHQPAKKVEPPTMSLGEISTRLGFNVTSAFLASLGFEATTVRAAKLYHDDDFPRICAALVDHINSVCETA